MELNTVLSFSLVSLAAAFRSDGECEGVETATTVLIIISLIGGSIVAVGNTRLHSPFTPLRLLMILSLFATPNTDSSKQNKAVNRLADCYHLHHDNLLHRLVHAV